MAERGYQRSERVAEELRREISVILTREVSDPRLAGIGVSGIRLSRDLRDATLYVTAPEGADRRSVVAGLAKARGFVQRQLARRVYLKRLPRLHFSFDEAFEQAMRIDRLLAEQRRETARPADETAGTAERARDGEDSTVGEPGGDRTAAGGPAPSGAPGEDG